MRDRFLLHAAACLLVAASAGCGGASGGGAAQATPAERLSSYDAAGLTTLLDQQFGAGGVLLLQYGGALRCGVDFYHYTFDTHGAAGEAATASAGLLIPTGSAAACSGARPLVLYGHGDSLYRWTNMADISAGNAYRATTGVIAALFAAQGYVVVAPNYAGYDTSTLDYHPEHIAAQNGQEMMDALAAARKALGSLGTGVSDNGQLFLTGYSEGGYVAMAAHRALQLAGIPVTASAPLSGSYAESVAYEQLAAPGALDDLSGYTLSDRMGFAQQITAWQKAYGNLYATPEDVYPAAYGTGMETLLPTSASDIATLVPARFPPYFLASDMPNFAALTVAEQAYSGAPAQSLLRTSYVTGLLADVVASQCPVTTADPLNCVPHNPTHAAWLKNDLRNWTPAAPMLLCGGNADTEVGFYNAQLTQAYFQAQGVSVPVLDVDAATSASGDPYAAAKHAFSAIKQLIALAGGDPASKDNYHGTMVFLGCNIAARDYFNGFVAP